MASPSRAKRRKPRENEAGTTPATARPSRKGWLFALLLLILPFLLYAPAINGPLVLDDYDLMEVGSAVRDGGLPALRRSGRPVLMLSFVLNHRLAGGFDPFWFHLTNILLHGVNALLVWLFLRLIFAHGRLDQWVRRDWQPLLVYGLPLLFLASPIQTESVAYISSRSEVLAASWYLAALCVFASPLREKSPWGTAVIVAGFFGLAALTKQDKLSLPFVILATDYLIFAERDFRKLRANWPTYAVFVVGIVVGVIYVVMPFLYAPTAGFGLDWKQYLFTQFRAIFYYFKLLAVPVGLNIDPDFPPSPTIWEHLSWLAMAALVALAGVVIKFHRRRPVIAFGAAFFFLTLAPSSSFYPVVDFVAERRLYLPSIGFYLVLILGLAWALHAQRKVALAVLALIIAAYAAGTFERSQVWASELALWTDSVQKSPEKWRPWNWLGRVYSDRGQHAKAIQAWEKAEQFVRPGSYEQTYIFGNLGLAYANLKDHQKAVEYYQKALEISPGEARLRAQLAVAQIRLGKEEEGWESFEQAFQHARPAAELFRLRGQEHFLVERYQQAFDDFSTAHRMRPDDEVAKQNMEAAQEMLRRQ